MRLFFSEYRTDYTTYTFGYTAYCQPESASEIPAAYAQGFLPYTGDTSLNDDTFYMARSLRIELDRFEDSSENRRVDRKASELALHMQVTAKEAFDLHDPTFVAFCTEYAAERFAGGEMSTQRFEYVLSRSLLTHLITFRTEERVFGYVLACIHGDMLHYWFSFFDTEYMQSHALGKWMMWKTIRWAKDNGLSHVYLGTCYQPKSLYKVRDHKGIAFFDGRGWNPDASLLKHLCQQDPEPRNADLFKATTDSLAQKLYADLRR